MNVVLGGLIARFPLGGVAIDYLQYVLGLERLGCEVFYLEDTGQYCYDPAEQTFTPDCSRNFAYLTRTLARYGIGEGRFCLRNWDGTCHGVGHERLLEVLRAAELFVNVSGTCWLRDEYREMRMRKVFIDSDPGYNQVWIALGSRPQAERKLAAAVERIKAHDDHFTFAENIGGPGASLPPTPGIRWRTTRQPIVLDLFEPRGPFSARELYTTVMNWSPHGYELEYEGRRYGGKAAPFLRYVGLPERFGKRFEVALAGRAPREQLKAAGFVIVDAALVSANPERYLDYLATSRGEWSVAKEVYTAMRTGWFSGRSACYLALGRPVIVEDTGFSPYYPCGSAIFPFSNEDDVGAALETIDGDYEKTCRAAREVAEACFDARRVLGAILEHSAEEH